MIFDLIMFYDQTRFAFSREKLAELNKIATLTLAPFQK